jgi:capsule polysaccharide export protein KpsE/RkpR
VTIAAAVVSVVIAFVLPVYYKSETVFYAASPDLGKPEKIFGMTNTEMQYYGSDDDVDRILSMASSANLMDFLIDSFDLMQYYDIKPEKTAARTLARRQLNDDLTMMKNEQGAIQLSMIHKDPEAAAQIVKAARNHIEKYILSLLKRGQERVVETFEGSIAEKSERLVHLADTLDYIRDFYGIIDPSSQGEVLASLLASTESKLNEAKAQLNAMRRYKAVSQDTIALLTARVAGLEQKMESLTETDGSQYTSIKKYNEGLNDYLYFDQQYHVVKNDLTSENRRLQYYKSAMSSSPPGIHVIEEAQVPEKKHKPVRSLIVIIGTLGAFIFTLLIILLIETFQKFPWEHVRNGSR